MRRDRRPLTDQFRRGLPAYLSGKKKEPGKVVDTVSRRCYNPIVDTVSTNRKERVSCLKEHLR